MTMGSMKQLFMILAFLAITGCVTGTGRKNAAVAPGPSWPAPPEPARIQLSDILDATDFKPGRSGLWAQLARLLTGGDQPTIVRPHGLFAANGTLFIADPGDGSVHQVELKTGKHNYLGSDGEVRLQSPIGITGNGKEQLYLTDSAAGRIYTCDIASGEFRPLSPYPLHRPTGIAFNKVNGLIYAVDTMAHEVVAFDRQGIPRLRFGGRGGADGQFNYPTAIYADRKGELWITDSMNFRIQHFSSSGEFLGSFGENGNTTGRFSKPKGIAVDSDGHVYVCSSLFDAVQIFDADGTLMLWFGDKGNRPGQFWMPSGIFIDDNDTIYVSDTYNRRIQVFRYLGTAEETAATALSAKGDRQ